jgi:thiamine biosynthesis lipoprotein
MTEDNMQKPRHRKLVKWLRIAVALFFAAAAVVFVWFYTFGLFQTDYFAFAADADCSQTVFYYGFAAPNDLSLSSPNIRWAIDWHALDYNSSNSDPAKCLVKDDIALADSLCRETGGAFNPYMGRLISLWNIDNSDGSAPHVPTQDEIAAVLPYCDYTKIAVPPESRATADDKFFAPILPNGFEAQFGAMGKGEICDDEYAFVKKNRKNRLRIAGEIATIGGNIFSYGNKGFGKAFQVALVDPTHASDEAGRFQLRGTYFISTSGNYEKNFTQNGKTYGHILDWKTGYPAEAGNLLSVSVITTPKTDPTHAGAIGDALSTASFVLGYNKAKPILEAHHCDAIFLYADGTARAVGSVQSYFQLSTTRYNWVAES